MTDALRSIVMTQHKQRCRIIGYGQPSKYQFYGKNISSEYCESEEVHLHKYVLIPKTTVLRNKSRRIVTNVNISK
ncbi:unnamed protein product, partial [Brenthis ino]